MTETGTPGDFSELVDHDLITRELTSRWTFYRDGVECMIEPCGRIILPDAAAQKVNICGHKAVMQHRNGTPDKF